MPCFVASAAAELSMSGRIHLAILSESPQILSSRYCFAACATSRAAEMWPSSFCVEDSSSRMKPCGIGEESFLPHFTEQIRTKRKGKVGKVWMVDETFIRIKWVWCYLYRDIDDDGNPVDVRLSKTRDMAGTKTFFTQAYRPACGLAREGRDRWLGLLATGDYRRIRRERCA